MAWAKFLVGLERELSWSEYEEGETLSPYDKFKAISPYKGKDLVTVVMRTYGGVARVEGVKEWLNALLTQIRSKEELSNQVLIVAMPSSLKEGMEIVSQEYD